VRGQSVASETATAQRIKGQYASLRLKVYQDDVARFATHMLQLKAQIICKHFEPETIATLAAVDQLNPADQQYIGPAMALLKDEPMRSFRIEISSDSMIAMNESQEKQDRIEFLGAVGGFLEKAVQASQTSPQIVPLVLDLLKFGVTGFKVGRSVEGIIDQAADQFKQDQQTKQQTPPPPNPEMLKLQAEHQDKQMDMQFEQTKMQNEAQLEMAKQQHEQQLEAARMAQEERMRAMEIQAEAESKFRIAKLESETKLAVAQINVNQAKQEEELKIVQMQREDYERQSLHARAKQEEELNALMLKKQEFDNNAMHAFNKNNHEMEILHAQKMLVQNQLNKPSENEALAATMQGIQQALAKLSQPRKVVRDENGKIVGVQ
jgi:hypothetical protein